MQDEERLAFREASERKRDLEKQREEKRERVRAGGWKRRKEEDEEDRLEAS